MTDQVGPPQTREYTVRLTVTGDVVVYATSANDAKRLAQHLTAEVLREKNLSNLDTIQVHSVRPVIRR